MHANTAENSGNSAVRPPRPFYTRLAALGFLLIALAGLVALAFGLFSGDMSSLPFELPMVVVGLLVAGALMRFGLWAQILALVLSILVLALLLPFSSFNLLHPESAPDFVPLLLLIAGALFGLVGSVVSIIQRQRHTLRQAATPAESAVLKVALAVIALVAVVSLVITAGERTTVSASSKSNAVSMEQKNFAFNPGRIETKAGQTVQVAVNNGDNTLHTFTLDEAGVNVSVPPGAERLIEFRAPASGTYQWYCIPHASSGPSGKTGMVGSLVVQ